MGTRTEQTKLARMEGGGKKEKRKKEKRKTCKMNASRAHTSFKKNGSY